MSEIIIVKNGYPHTYGETNIPDAVVCEETMIENRLIIGAGDNKIKQYNPGDYENGIFITDENGYVKLFPVVPGEDENCLLRVENGSLKWVKRQ